MKGRNLSRIFTLLVALVMLVTVITVTALTSFAAAPSSYTDIALDSPHTVSVSGSGRYYRFIPQVTGIYRIYSYNLTQGDPYVYLNNYEGYQIEYDDDGGDGYNFMLDVELNAGSTYYINPTCCSDSASYTFKIMLEEEITPEVYVYTEGMPSYGNVSDFYVYFNHINYYTDVVLTPTFDANIFEYVSGEWLAWGDNYTIDNDTMTATLSCNYETYSGYDAVYRFSLLAKSESDLTDVGVDAPVKHYD